MRNSTKSESSFSRNSESHALSRENEEEDDADDQESSPSVDEREGEEDELADPPIGDQNSSKPRKIHKLSLRKTEDFNEKLRKRGVVYVARIPPRMTPTKMKRLLSEFGEVTRIFLQEEDAAVRKRRRKLSGNGSKRYVEGWVEFDSKKVAKHVAQSLNATQISNHKRNPHYGDLWMLKYLSNFQWSHLTEKVAYERRVREQKLRLETMQAKRETAAYKHLVETGKKLDKIEERKRRRTEKEGMEAPKKKIKPTQQVKPVVDGGEKPSKRALLGALV